MNSPSHCDSNSGPVNSVNTYFVRKAIWIPDLHTSTVWDKADLVQASKQSCDEWPRLWNHIASGMSSVKNQVLKVYTIAHMKNDHFEKFGYCWPG